MANLTSALTTAFTDISGNLMTALGSIIPIALGIVGAVIVVTFGVKMFKRLSGTGRGTN